MCIFSIFFFLCFLSANSFYRFLVFDIFSHEAVYVYVGDPENLTSSTPKEKPNNHCLNITFNSWFINIFM